MKKLVLVAFLGTLNLAMLGQEPSEGSQIIKPQPVNSATIYQTQAFKALVDAMVGIVQQVHDHACSGAITQENIHQVVGIYEKASKALYYKLMAVLRHTVTLDQGKGLRDLLDGIKETTKISPCPGQAMSNAWDKAIDRFYSGLPDDENLLKKLRDVACNLTLSESGPDRVVMDTYIRALDRKLYAYLLDKDGNLIECR